MKTASKIIFAIAFAISGAATTQATPIIGAQIFVQHTGHVTATFTGADALYNDLLLLASPPNGLGTIFEGHATPIGNTVDLGVFAAGTELVFELNNQVGGIFFSGPASRNPDDVAHAVVDDQFAQGLTLVGFEDMFGGGDFDYNDLEFTLTNVGTRSVPDTGSTAMLLGSAIFVLAFFRRFRQR